MMKMLIKSKINESLKTLKDIGFSDNSIHEFLTKASNECLHEIETEMWITVIEDNKK